MDKKRFKQFWHSSRTYNLLKITKVIYTFYRANNQWIFSSRIGSLIVLCTVSYQDVWSSLCSLSHWFAEIMNHAFHCNSCCCSKRCGVASSLTYAHPLIVHKSGMSRTLHPISHQLWLTQFLCIFMCPTFHQILHDKLACINHWGFQNAQDCWKDHNEKVLSRGATVRKALAVDSYNPEDIATKVQCYLICKTANPAHLWQQLLTQSATTSKMESKFST